MTALLGKLIRFWLFASIAAALLPQGALAKTEFIGHRGAVRLAPENTLSAIRAAARSAKIVELDVRMTRDLHAVLLHDETVDRTTDGVGRVSELTVEDIKKLDAGSYHGAAFAGERVPTLQEALAETKRLRMTALLDVKNCSAAAVTDAIRGARAERSTIVSSDRRDFLAEVHKLLPAVSLAFQGTTLLPEAEFRSHASALKRAGINYVLWNKPGLPLPTLRSYQKQKIKVFVWVSDDMAETVRLFHGGVDGILTNDPAGLSTLSN